MKSLDLKHRSKLYVIVLPLILISSMSFGQSDADELAQDLQNPLASLIAVPVLQQFTFESSQNEALGYDVSFQPIFPFKFEKFNIVNRIIFGYGYVPGLVMGTGMLPAGEPDNGNEDGKWGFSDLNYSFYFSPKTKHKVAWGVGPSLNLPTANDNRLGTGKWSVGASVVMVYQPQNWTFDLVFRQIWSVAGDEERLDVNQFVAQPLIAYGLGKGWMINTFPTITANWNFEEGQKWTLPLGAGVSKVVFLGKLPMAAGVQYYYYVVRPDLAPNSELRVTTTFILSK